MVWPFSSSTPSPPPRAAQEPRAAAPAEQSSAARVAAVGLPVFVNAPADTRRRALRSLRRMVRLSEHAAKADLPQRIRDEAVNEYQQRSHQLAMSGYTIPPDRAGLAQLVNELQRYVAEEQRLARQ